MTRLNLRENSSKLVLVLELNLNLVLASDLFDLYVCVKNLSQLSGSTLERLWCHSPRPRLGTLDRKQRGKIFCLSYRKAFRHNLLSKPNPAFLCRNCKNGTRVSRSQKALLHHLLNLSW